MRRAYTILLLVAACTAPTRYQYRFDGIVIAPGLSELGGEPSVDAETLFRWAFEAGVAGDYGRAKVLYTRYVEWFPQSRRVPDVYYNMGLLFENEQNYGEALRYYELLNGLFKTSATQLARSGLFRRGVCLAKLGRWADSAAIFEHLLGQDDLEPTERLEAWLGHGLALEEDGKRDEARQSYGALLMEHRKLRTDNASFDDRGFGAEAAFRLGRLASLEFDAVQLAFPIEVLRVRLEEKCVLLLAAQGRFFEAMRLGDRYTVAISGYHIGGLYESLYRAIDTLQTPSELDREATALYQEEVRARIQVLLKKAIHVYERTLLVSRTDDTAGAWNEKIVASLDRLRQMYQKQSHFSTLTLD